MANFTPPSYEEGIPTKQRPLCYFRITQSMSVVRVSGVLVAVKTPTDEQLTAAGTEGRDWFLGGHTYQVSAGTATELTAAGFTVES